MTPTRLEPAIRDMELFNASDFAPSPPASSLTEVPCISLWRPWALWVRAGWKTIETRLHDRFKGLEGKRIAIHAALMWDDHAAISVHKHLWLGADELKQTSEWKRADFGAGQVVALATVDGTGWLSSQASHERKALIECKTARFGLYLTDIEPVSGPVVKGRQGIFHARINPSNAEAARP